jgi:Family of unknown function (DUF6331)
MMSNAPTPIPELEIPERLNHLIQYCEKLCVAQCCGIDAFDFSPLHIASFVSGSGCAIDDSVLVEWNALIDEFERSYRMLQPLPLGYLVCVTMPMNQLFTAEAFEALIAELRISLATAPEVLALSDRLRVRITASKVMKNYADQERNSMP